MYKCFLLVCLSVQLSIANAGCLSGDQLKDLALKQTEYLLDKVPPAFAHAHQANKIQIMTLNVESDQCQARLKITLPQDELNEANAILDAQPAKKIMLAAQGQGLPTSTSSEAIFELNKVSLAVAEADQLQTGQLGRLRASIELMYALITQTRAALKPAQINEIAWSTQDTQQVTDACADKQSVAFCSCLANKYAEIISPEQMDYIDYIEANPYALATGVNQQFEALKKSASNACQG